jgi:purine-binding chemotaxis protein CheW
VAGTEFACPVRNLREVVELVEIARAEGGAGRIDGVINYRGVVIAVVDARRVLGFPPRSAAADAHILIAEVADRVVGLVVDAVLDVLTLGADSVEAPGALVPLRALLMGIAKLGDRLLFVLDLERLLSDTELGELPPMAALEPAGEPLRSIFRRRAGELAKPVAAGERLVADLTAMVCFALGEGSYAVRAEHAREIVPVPRITPVPSAPAFVMGAVNIRGAIVAVVSVAALLGFRASSSNPADARIIVVEAAGAVVGLGVDRVLGIYEVPAQHLAPPLAQLEAEPGACIEAEFDHGGAVVCVVDAEAVVRMLEQGAAVQDASMAADAAALGAPPALGNG